MLFFSVAASRFKSKAASPGLWFEERFGFEGFSYRLFQVVIPLDGDCERNNQTPHTTNERTLVNAILTRDGYIRFWYCGQYHKSLI